MAEENLLEDKLDTVIEEVLLEETAVLEFTELITVDETAEEKELATLDKLDTWELAIELNDENWVLEVVDTELEVTMLDEETTELKLLTLLETRLAESLLELALGITKPPGLLLTVGAEIVSALALSLPLFVSLIVIATKVITAKSTPKPINTS